MTDHIRLNNEILFGRPCGKKTRGKIIKINQRTCKVSQIGEFHKQTGRTLVEGTVWTVPIELIYPLDDTTNTLLGPIVPQQVREPPPKREITDFWLMDHQHEIHILDKIYNHLSPENLSGDGERPINQIRKLRAELERKLHAVFVLLERELDEVEAYNSLERIKKLHENGKHTAFSTLEV